MGVTTLADEKYMRMAMELAEKGRGFTNPNPLVGAVIVKDGEVIGQGWHRAFGLPHAEREALAACSATAEGATLYVTLEPCCHHGKTPPCTEAVVKSGIARVVAGVRDPNPMVAGKGLAELRDAGIEVAESLLEAELAAQNEIFFHYIKTRLPFVVMKYAMTADGKIASRTGASKWITGEEARARVQEERGRLMAIMVGLGTLLADDPLLTCRVEGARSPIRVICDTRLGTPLDCQAVLSAREAPTWIATASEDEERAKAYLDKGCRVIRLPAGDGGVDLKALMAALGQEGVDSLLLEGGGRLNWQALRSGVVSRVQAYIAPKIMGGADALTPVEGLGAESPGDAFLLKNSRVIRLGDDIMIESEVEG